MVFASGRSRLLAPSPRRSPRSVIGIRRQMRKWGCPFRRQLACLGAPHSRLFQHWLRVGILIAVGGEDGSDPLPEPRIQVVVAVVACPTWLHSHTNIVVVSACRQEHRPESEVGHFSAAARDEEVGKICEHQVPSVAAS